MTTSDLWGPTAFKVEYTTYSSYHDSTMSPLRLQSTVCCLLQTLTSDSVSAPASAAFQFAAVLDSKSPDLLLAVFLLLLQNHPLVWLLVLKWPIHPSVYWQVYPFNAGLH